MLCAVLAPIGKPPALCENGRTAPLDHPQKMRLLFLPPDSLLLNVIKALWRQARDRRLGRHAYADSAARCRGVTGVPYTASSIPAAVNGQAGAVDEA